MNTNEKLARLRAMMKHEEISAYIIPSNDPHMSEYVSEHWKSRMFFSGFTGSAGTLVVTEKESGLWTDGRYYIQAEKQLAGSEIKLFRMGEKGVPTYTQFIADTLNENECVGIDGRIFAAATVKNMRKAFEAKHLKIRSNIDLVAPIWLERPKESLTSIYLHEKKYTGASCNEKLMAVRNSLEKEKVDGYVLCELASIAWLFNIRANDIAFNPMAIAYAFVTNKQAYLCTELSRMPQEVQKALQDEGVTLMPYEAIYGLLKGIGEPMKILCHEGNVNETLYSILVENPYVTVQEGEELVCQLKAIKNEVEIANIDLAHIKDGCALTHFMVELEEKLANKETVTEYDVVGMLKKARAAQINNKGESFASIVAYKENAAMMHYAPTETKHKKLKEEGLLLIDSGGQYLEGTTDITRTFALGPTTTEEKMHYTLTLKSHIAMAKAVFMEGCTGANLDILARKPMWEKGLDYKCGTGHGVGFMLGVHEGPQSLRTTNNVPFKEGMLITDEPGVYMEGKHGIRIENILVVTDYMTTPSGHFYQFKNVTYFPIDTKPLLTKLLSKEELEWLNSYHQTVYEKLSPQLEGRALEWLRRNTEAITA